LYHDLNMIKILTFVFGLLFIIGCSEDKLDSPKFPEILNPLDDEDERQKAFENATELELLLVSEDMNSSVYQNNNGSLYSGWVKKTYDDGKMGYLFHCKDGKQHGLHTAWYKNGKKMVERTWVNGVREGPYKYWSAFGTLEFRGYYKNNLKDGLVEEFYPDGRKKAEINYLGGKIMSYKKWKADGAICPITSIKGGTGVIAHYREDGTVDFNETYLDGEIDYGGALDAVDVPSVENEIFDEENETDFSIIPISNPASIEQNNSE
jgi:antitoxin component YwqK of YwqJK toxin-antitoxin module